MENQKRTVIRGFRNSASDEEPEVIVPEATADNTKEPEEINVTWVFWLLGGLSVASLALSIISLIIACK